MFPLQLLSVSNNYYLSLLFFQFFTAYVKFLLQLLGIINHYYLLQGLFSNFLQLMFLSQLLSKSHRDTMRRSMFLIILGVAVVCHALRDSPKGLHFVGVGYNLLKGNPEGGEVSNGGVDPGLLFTRKTFKLTWSENKVTVDNKYKIPDQLSFAPPATRKRCFLARRVIKKTLMPMWTSAVIKNVQERFYRGWSRLF